MQEYINGCYTKYGSRPLNFMEIKKKMQLPNGMVAVMGYINTEEDGFSIDVYRDDKLQDLVFMEHGIVTNMDPNDMSDDEWGFLFQVAVSRCAEMKI